MRGFLIKNVCVPLARRKLFCHDGKPSSHQPFVNYKKDKLLILLRVGLSHSPSVPSSKCVFSQHRKCKLGNILSVLWALRATGFPPGAGSPGDSSWQGEPEERGRGRSEAPAAARAEGAEALLTPGSLWLGERWQRPSSLTRTPGEALLPRPI